MTLRAYPIKRRLTLLRKHTIYFIGRGERIELSHRAATRGHFAVGAVRAAAWIVGREAGLYRIEHVLGLE